jgi:hypothetical protein
VPDAIIDNVYRFRVTPDRPNVELRPAFYDQRST